MVLVLKFRKGGEFECIILVHIPITISFLNMQGKKIKIEGYGQAIKVW
jgi:hypothetical protein